MSCGKSERTTAFGRIVAQTTWKRQVMTDTGCWIYRAADGSYTDTTCMADIRRTVLAGLGRTVKNPVAICKSDSCVNPEHLREGPV